MNSHIIKRLLLGAVLLVSAASARADYRSYEEAAAAGKAQQEKGDFVALQKTAEEQLLLAQTPDQKAEALLGLGLSYSQRKLYPQAREQWTKLVELGEAPDNSKLTAYSLMGASYGEENEWRLARAEFEKAVALPVVTTQEKANLGLAIAATFFNEKNSVEGRKQLAAITDNPAVDANFRAMVYSQLGQELVNEGEFEEARAAFKQTLGFATTPGELRVAAQAGIAHSFKVQGDEPQAQAAFVQAQSEALKQMALLAQAKRYDAALVMAEQARTFGKVAPTLDAVLQTQIAHFLLGQGKPEEARKRLKELIEKEYGTNIPPKDEASLLLIRQTAQLTIARSFVGQGDKEQAQRVLQDLLATKNLLPSVKLVVDKELQALGVGTEAEGKTGAVAS